MYILIVHCTVRDRAVVLIIMDGLVMIFCRTLQKPKQGFTLVELLVTVAVLAIVASIAAPAIETQLANRRIKNAATELTSTFVQARALAINTARNVEIWPAYAGGWTVPMVNRKASIRLPNAGEILKNDLITAKLSWYVVTAGTSTSAGAQTIATSTANSYPIQVSLPDDTVITVTSSSASAADVNKGLRFFPTGGMSVISATATSFTTNTSTTFTICDRAVAKLPAYTIIVSPSGGVRSSRGTTTCP